MQLVQDDAAQAREVVGGILVGQQQRQRFRRGQQHVRRMGRAAAARRFCGVSPVRVSIRTGEPHLLDRAGSGCARCRWPAPSAARRRACAAARWSPRSCSSTRLGRNPPSVLPPPVGAISSASRPPGRARASRPDGAEAASRGRRTTRRRAPRGPLLPPRRYPRPIRRR